VILPFGGMRGPVPVLAVSRPWRGGPDGRGFRTSQRLLISPRAVEKHVTSIFAKLGLPSAPEDHRRLLTVLRFLGS